MEAVPAVIASTWEWISCLDSSILFLRQAWDALNKEEKKTISLWSHDKDPEYTSQHSYRISISMNPLNKGEFNLTASVPRGGRVSKSSREAWAAWTACILELMVPVRACWAEVCGHTKVLSLL